MSSQKQQFDDHNQAVLDFLAKCKEADPERYAQVCEQYPVVTPKDYRRNRMSEVTVGLLGLQASRIPTDFADEYGYESAYRTQEAGEVE